MLLGICPAAPAGTVVVWGNGTYGALNVPTNLTAVVKVASGSEHCLALQTNGVAVAWGWNYFGQTNVPDLGFNGINWYPVNGAITNIAVGDNHTLALRTDGSIVTWGDNSGRQ
jgi:alpha-tubulin suppressor-like RCC1 family protein